MNATTNNATTSDATTNECYNEQIISIKLGCYKEKRSYNEHGRIIFIMESSIVFYTRERLFMLFMGVRLFMLFIRECLFIVCTYFMLFKFIYTAYKS